MTDLDLAKLAFEISKRAYAPYSKFYVGACVLLKDGTVIEGVNIENASYGLTSCAERNALFATYSRGYNKNDIEKIAIVCKHDEIISPCGACRQVLSELLNFDTPIILANNLDNIYLTNARQLLPLAFERKHLDI